jgi:hypothetical protein
MHAATARRLIASFVLVTLVAACGGGGGAVGQPGSDPVSTVNSLVATIQQKQFDKLADLACAASKDQLKSAFDPTGSLGGAAALGVTAADILAVISIEMSNVTIGAPSVSGDTATVHMKADMKMTADQGKLKELFKKILTNAGQPADDATVNLAVGAAGSQFSRTQAIDEDVTLKQEGGKWLVCES